MPERGGGDGRTALDDVRHPLVPRHLPDHLHVVRRHPPAVERIPGQPGPEHDAVGRRIAGRHPERKDRRLEAAATRRAAGGPEAQQRRPASQYLAAIHPAVERVDTDAMVHGLPSG